VIEIVEVSKNFGNVSALDNVSLNFGEGQIIGLLGVNGAGKSTLMRLIYGLLAPSSGHIRVAGVDVQRDPIAARGYLGVLPDNTGLYKRLTARENILYFGRLQGMSEAALQRETDHLLALLGMESIAHRVAEGFSLGERMKTALARAIVHQPQYVLLDEPTNGLDVMTTRAVRRLLQAQKAAGKTVLLSSHLMYEVENLCDQIVVIAGGRVMAQGTPQAVTQQAGCQQLEDAFIKLSGLEETEA